MAPIRWLLGTVGALLGVVLVILGIVLSPVLLLLAPIPLLIYAVWKLMKARRAAGRVLQQPAKQAQKAGTKVKKRMQKAL
jgi:hypothetical protein